MSQMLSTVSSCNTVALDRGTIQCPRILRETFGMLSLIIGDTDVSNVLHVGLGGLGGGEISCSSSRCLGVANSAGWIPGESSKRPGRGKRKRKRGN